MKKFQFPLEKLLNYKNQVLEGELQKLSELNMQHQLAIDKQDAIRQKYEQCKSKLEGKLSETVTPSECQMYRHYIVELSDQMKALQREIDRLSSRIAEQILVVRQMRTEVKSIENLRETKLDDFKREESRREEVEMDEYVAAAKYY